MTPTICILSHNRQHILDQTVRYYLSNGIRAAVFDNSELRARNAILEDKNVDYFHIPNCSFFEQFNCAVEFSRDLNLHYVAICPDEDLFAVNGLCRSIECLTENPQASSIVGRTLDFEEKPRFITFSGGKPKVSLTDESPRRRMERAAAGRLLNLWGVYSIGAGETFFKIHRDVGETIGDKSAEMFVGALVPPMLGQILAISDVLFVRRNSKSLRFDGRAAIGTIPFTGEIEKFGFERIFNAVQTACLRHAPGGPAADATFFREMHETLLTAWRIRAQMQSSPFKVFSWPGPRILIVNTTNDIPKQPNLQAGDAIFPLNTDYEAIKKFIEDEDGLLNDAGAMETLFSLAGFLLDNPSRTSKPA